MFDFAKTLNAIREEGVDTIPRAQFREFLKCADDAYFNDECEPLIRDAEYDAYRRAFAASWPDDVYLTGSGSAVRGEAVKLPYPMGSLIQSFETEIPTWIKKHRMQKAIAAISDKIDGVSSLIIYGDDGKLQISYSKGDGFEAADTYRHTSKIRAIPQKVRTPNLVVRGELVFADEVFDNIISKMKRRDGKPYKTARNAAAGIMNASVSAQEALDNLSFVAYTVLSPAGLSKSEQFNLLKQEGFEVVRHSCVQMADIAGDDSDEELSKYLIAQRESSRYAIDGIVIEVDDTNWRAKIDTGSADPEYARKYKVADESAYGVTTVREVEFNLSKDGYAKPRVWTDPVQLLGATVQKFTGHNALNILESGIHPGCKIRVVRSGDVIPFILGVVEEGPNHHNMKEWLDTELDNQIGAGLWKWNDTYVDVVLKDGASNDRVQFMSMLDFFNTIGVDNLGEGNLQTLFDLDFTTIESVIELTKEDMCEALKSKSIGTKVWTNLRKALTNIPKYKLMGAHPCFGRGVGVRKMKALYDANGGDMSICADETAIQQVPGFKQTARKIADGYDEYVKFEQAIEGLFSYEPYSAPKEGVFSGMTFCFTGFRSESLEQEIVNRGGKMSSGVSSKLTYLVAANPNESSGKLDKARALEKAGVRIIDPQTLQGML